MPSPWPQPQYCICDVRCVRSLYLPEHFLHTLRAIVSPSQMWWCPPEHLLQVSRSTSGNLHVSLQRPFFFDEIWAAAATPHLIYRKKNFKVTCDFWCCFYCATKEHGNRRWVDTWRSCANIGSSFVCCGINTRRYWQCIARACRTVNVFWCEYRSGCAFIVLVIADFVQLACNKDNWNIDKKLFITLFCWQAVGLKCMPCWRTCNISRASRSTHCRFATCRRFRIFLGFAGSLGSLRNVDTKLIAYFQKIAWKTWFQSFLATIEWVVKAVFKFIVQWCDLQSPWYQ